MPFGIVRERGKAIVVQQPGIELDPGGIPVLVMLVLVPVGDPEKLHQRRLLPDILDWHGQLKLERAQKVEQ